MQDFEKLGAFYLGKRFDTEADQLTDEVVLYDAKDLTTHAVIIGMTGSGKTGLGIGILEEAALDNIPVIAIDPKGDMGNILLTFPQLRPEDFRPWINARAASDKGQTADEYASGQAALWKKGLGQWGQTGARITQMRKNVDLAIYTPGSNAGMPVSVLQSFAAPDAALIEDVDLYREHVQATATGILTLLGIDADPAVQPYFDLHAQVNETDISFQVNRFENITVEQLQDIHTIIGSDICFWEELTPVLFDFIKRALQAGVKKIIIADPGRTTFWKLCELVEDRFRAESFEYKTHQPKKTTKNLLVVDACS